MAADLRETSKVGPGGASVEAGTVCLCCDRHSVECTIPQIVMNYGEAQQQREISK